MKSNKSFAITVLSLAMIFSCIAAIPTIIVDPFLHFHKPLKCFYYELTAPNQRNLNNGIIRHFNYNAIITGTSMTENFKASEADKIFNVTSIKIPFSGGGYKEINDNLKVAFKHNKNINIVIRGLDSGYLATKKDFTFYDKKKYPYYINNSNPFDDVQYLFNSDLLHLSLKMILAACKGNKGGITDFDHYSYWMPGKTFGKEAVLWQNRFEQPKEIIEFTEENRQNVIENIEQNVTSLARKYPDCTFYYFITPLSAVWWGMKKESGLLESQFEIEKIAIENIIECENIKLFSFNNEFDIITNLNNYKDFVHYGEWINSLMLEYMAQDKCLLTKDNYLSYLEKEKEFYSTFDYNSLFDQIDEEDPPCDLQ